MKSHVPFVNTVADAQLLRSVAPTTELVRVCIDVPPAAVAALSNGTKLWVDGSADALHEWPAENKGLRDILRAFGADAIGKGEKPTQQATETFVNSLLDKCLAFTPTPVWLSVPQIPISRDGTATAVNRALAAATGKWQAARKYSGQLVLPVILVHVEQVHFKPRRMAILSQAEGRRVKAGAHGIWVVNAGLDDQSGSITNEKKTFPGLLALHEELRGVLPSPVFVVAGPYWGIGLILWARGLVDHTASGVGGMFRYFIAGGPLRTSKTRIAIPPLKRLAVANVELQKWIDRREKEAIPGSATHKELLDLKKLFPQVLHDREVGRSQIAVYYWAWLKRIDNTAAPGRALALYQELSSAYVIGKGIDEKLPQAEDVTNPAKIAQHLMMSCL